MSSKESKLISSFQQAFPSCLLILSLQPSSSFGASRISPNLIASGEFLLSSAISSKSSKLSISSGAGGNSSKSVVFLKEHNLPLYVNSINYLKSFVVLIRILPSKFLPP